MLLLSVVCLFGAACTKSDPAPGTDPNSSEKPENAEFIVEVSDVGTVTVNVHITAKDKDMGYYSDVLTESDFLEAGKHGFDDYLQYVIKSLESQGKTYEEAVETITSYGSDDYILTTLKPNMKYYAVAVGIDKEGKSTTDVFSYNFTTLDVEASSNTFDITVSDETEFGAKVSVKTQNDDDYFMDIVPSGVKEEVEARGEDIRQYLIESHLAAGDLEDFILRGSKEFVAETLKPGWKYDVIAFGCKDGFANTVASVSAFSTLRGEDDSALCEFEFDCTLNVNGPSTFAFYPSDPTAVYICDAMFEADYQMLLESSEGDKDKTGAIILDEMIMMYAGDFGTRAETLNLLGTVGPYEYSIDIEPGEDYRMWAVCVDQNGNPTGKFITSEVFTAPEAVVSPATVNIIEYPWFDGDKLYELDPVMFKGAKGNAVVSLKVEPSADAAEWWAYVFSGDLRETSDKSIIKNLTEYGLPDMKNFTEGLVVAYWGESTICAVAKDADGNFGVPVRQYVDLTTEGALPVEQQPAAASRQLSLFPMMTNAGLKTGFTYRSAGKR